MVAENNESTIFSPNSTSTLSINKILIEWTTVMNRASHNDNRISLTRFEEKRTKLASMSWCVLEGFGRPDKLSSQVADHFELIVSQLLKTTNFQSLFDFVLSKFTGESALREATNQDLWNPTINTDVK